MNRINAVLLSSTMDHCYWTPEDVTHAQLLGLVPRGMTTAQALGLLDRLDFEDIVRVENREDPFQLEVRRPVEESKVDVSTNSFAALCEDSDDDD